MLVIAAGLLVYRNSFNDSFFRDDFGSILDNTTIRHLWPIGHILLSVHGGSTVAGRPLINLSLAINYALGGYHVWGYHALNLTVHILAGLTLLGVVRRTLLRPPWRDRFGAAADELALAIAVLWTVHPLQTDSVTYIIQRAESIMGLFYLLTLYCFIRGVDSPGPRLWYGLSVVACGLGMASKEVMVSAPLMVLLYDRAFVSSSFREAWRRRWALYLALASTWILLGYVVASAGNFATASMMAQERGLTRWQYLATQPGVILYYLRLSLWPYPLGLELCTWPIAKTWISILPPTLVIVCLLGASAWAWNRYPGWGFVGAWFFLILAPSSSFIPLNDLIFEHRMYLPLAAVVSLVVMGLYSLMGRRALAALVLVAVGLGCLTWRRNQDYRTEIAFWSDAVAKFPNDPQAHDSLAVALCEEGRLPEAIDHFQRALQLKPDFAEAHNDLGVVLMQRGRLREAMGHYEQALRLKPYDPKAHYNLGVALWQTGRMTEAMQQWDQAVQLKSDYAEAHNSLGNAFMRQGRVPKAIEHYEQAVSAQPDSAETHNNLGAALVKQDRLTEAIAQFQEALRIRPDYAKALYNLGVALEQTGKVDEAIRHYEQALRIDPDMVEAHYDLGIALEQVGRVPEAVEHYEQALRIKPDYADVQNRLARLCKTR